MKTDAELEPFMDKRVRVRLDSGVEGSGVLESASDWLERPMFTLAGSSPGAGIVYWPDMQFYADQVDEIEPV
jgi:hypothetical protein